MTQDVINVIGQLEGMAFIAQQDAKTLKMGCSKQGFFEDIARYNEDNVAALYGLVRELSEMLFTEENSNIELHPFMSEEVPF